MYEQQPPSAQTSDLAPLLTTDDVCRVLKIRRLFLYELVRRGDLHPIRIGRLLRFRQSQLDAFLRQNGGGYGCA